MTEKDLRRGRNRIPCALVGSGAAGCADHGPPRAHGDRRQAEHASRWARPRGRRRRGAAAARAAPRRRARPRLPRRHPRPAGRDGRRPHARAGAGDRASAAPGRPRRGRRALPVAHPADRRPGRRRPDRDRRRVAGRARLDRRPGDVLYGLKRGTEQTQLALAGDARGQTLLDFASTRLDELEALVDEAPNALPAAGGAAGAGQTVLAAGADPELVIATLETMDDQTTEGAAWLADRAVTTADDGPARRPGRLGGGADRRARRARPGAAGRGRRRRVPLAGRCSPRSSARTDGLQVALTCPRVRPSAAPTSSARRRRSACPSPPGAPRRAPAPTPACPAPARPPQPTTPRSRRRRCPAAPAPGAPADRHRRRPADSRCPGTPTVPGAADCPALPTHARPHPRRCRASRSRAPTRRAPDHRAPGRRPRACLPAPGRSLLSRQAHGPAGPTLPDRVAVSRSQGGPVPRVPLRGRRSARRASAADEETRAHVAGAASAAAAEVAAPTGRHPRT